MTAVKPRRPGLLTAAVVLIVFCILCGLGVWQVQRLKWKTDLLGRISALQGAPAEPVGPVLRRIGDGLDVSFVRVTLPCPDLERAPSVRLYAVVEGQASYRYVAACPLTDSPYRSLLIDRGFIPIDRAPAALPAGGSLAGPVTGVLRRPDGKTLFTPQTRQGLWYWRDIAGMAAALGAPGPAPVMLMLETPAPASGLPKPAPLPANIPNNHLGYAITWFGLAAALAGVYLAMLLRRRP